MNIETRHRHARKRRHTAITVAVIAAATACSSSQPPATPAVTAGQLSDHDVIRLRALDPTPAPAPRATTKPPAPKHHRAARISTATTIRRLRVTAYCYTGSRTYTGTWPKQGTAAVKKSTGIPFGAVLHVAGHGTFTVTDREPEYGASNVDLYMGWRPDCERWASNFGIRHLAVSVERAA